VWVCVGWWHCRLRCCCCGGDFIPAGPDLAFHNTGRAKDEASVRYPPPTTTSTSSMWDLFNRDMERPSLDSVMKLLTCESIALLRSVAGEENPRRRLEQSQEEGVPAAAVDPSSPTATSLLLSLSLPSVSSASASVTFGSSAAAVDPAVAAVVPLLSGCMWPTAFRVQESKYLCHTHHSASDVSCYLCKIMLVTTMFSVRCVTALPCL
jgi:hypothetical protein